MIFVPGRIVHEFTVRSKQDCVDHVFDSELLRQQVAHGFRVGELVTNETVEAGQRPADPLEENLSVALLGRRTRFHHGTLSRRR